MIFREIYRRGLIPARAGTTTMVRGRPVMGWAHPRSRGDHDEVPEHYKLQAGSSPLARGPRSQRLLAAARLGLIPARAGTTDPRDIIEGARRAHPRSRGDHRRCPCHLIE